MARQRFKRLAGFLSFGGLDIGHPAAASAVNLKASGT
jgi:hypothetical protein